MKKIVYMSHSEDQTISFAKKIGRSLKKGDGLALMGDFGSGKTTFVKGLALGLGLGKKGYVCSPSFVILKIYRARVPIYHFDLYRLNNSRDFFDIGFGEFVAADGVTVIEWAEKMKPFLPKNTLMIHFKIAGLKTRRLCLSCRETRHEKLFKKLKSLRRHELFNV
jgi:tRNA threonylcarbamoyladenosine biosynthesis protein TsaE